MDAPKIKGDQLPHNRTKPRLVPGFFWWEAHSIFYECFLNCLTLHHFIYFYFLHYFYYYTVACAYIFLLLYCMYCTVHWSNCTVFFACILCFYSAHYFRTFHQYPHLRRKKIQPPRTRYTSKHFSVNREQLLPERISFYKSPRSSGSGSLSLSNYSSPDEYLSEDIAEKIQEWRDTCYFELPYSSKRYK